MRRDDVMVTPLGHPQVEDPPSIDGLTRIISFAECKEVLHSRDFVTTSQARAPFLGDTLLDIDGGEHVKRRRLEGRLFARPLLQRYESELAPMVDRALAELVPDARGRVHANLDVLIRTILHRIFAAGIDLDPDDPPVYSNVTFMDTFSRFPVWLSGL
jgi:cytochrome P450